MCQIFKWPFLLFQLFYLLEFIPRKECDKHMGIQICTECHCYLVYRGDTY